MLVFSDNEYSIRNACPCPAPAAADVCEVVLHLHPLGILFKPLASFFATFLIVPLARVFGYWEAPIPAYVMLVGAAGTYLCLYESKRGREPSQHVEMAAVDSDDTTDDDDERAEKAARPLGTSALVGTATVEDDFPVSEHFHENAGKGWWLGGGAPKGGYQVVEAEEVEKHVLETGRDEAAGLLGGSGKGDGAGTGRSLVGFLLLGGIFGVLVSSMAVWVIVQKLVNDRCRVNEFGFTALDQVGAAFRSNDVVHANASKEVTSRLGSGEPARCVCFKLHEKRFFLFDSVPKASSRFLAPRSKGPDSIEHQ